MSNVTIQRINDRIKDHARDFEYQKAQRAEILENLKESVAAVADAKTFLALPRIEQEGRLSVLRVNGELLFDDMT